MTNQPENQNQELGSLMRQVDVPADLARRLKAIPDSVSSLETKLSEESRSKSRDNANWNRVLLAYVTLLAASLFGIWCIATFLPDGVEPRLTEDNTDRIEKQEADESFNSNGLPGNAKSNSAHLTSLEIMEDIKSQQTIIESTTDQLELIQLRAQLANLQREQPSNRIGSYDELSIVVTLTEQAGLSYGSDIETVQAGMQNIMRKFPNSTGAQLAEEFISKTN